MFFSRGIESLPQTQIFQEGYTGSRSTFEFPSRVNLSGPSFTVPSSMDRASRCNKVDAVRFYAFYR